LERTAQVAQVVSKTYCNVHLLSIRFVVHL
jgi:hypothetical protein